jgi:hypothetical protein
MKRHGATILVVVLTTITIWGMICPASGQEILKRVAQIIDHAYPYFFISDVV